MSDISTDDPAPACTFILLMEFSNFEVRVFRLLPWKIILNKKKITKGIILQRMKFIFGCKKSFYYLKKGVGVFLMSLSKVDLPKKNPKRKTKIYVN